VLYLYSLLDLRYTAGVLFKNFHQDLQDAKAFIAEAQRRQTEQYNKKRRAVDPDTFKIGDKVLLSGVNISPKTSIHSKLSPLWYGPFEITKSYPDTDNFGLDLPPHWKVHRTFHVSLLKPYHENDDKRFPNRALSKPPPVVIEIDSDEEEWEVDKVLDFKEKRGKDMYLVRWKGYGRDEDSWEPVEHLEHAEEAIEEFHKVYGSRASLLEKNKKNRKKRARK